MSSSAGPVDNHLELISDLVSEAIVQTGVLQPYQYTELSASVITTIINLRLGMEAARRLNTVGETTDSWHSCSSADRHLHQQQLSAHLDDRGEIEQGHGGAPRRHRSVPAHSARSSDNRGQPDDARDVRRPRHRGIVRVVPVRPGPLSTMLWMLLFFGMAYFMIASIMASVGGAVSTCMTPNHGLTISCSSSLVLWMPISEAPNGMLAMVASWIS